MQFAKTLIHLNVANFRIVNIIGFNSVSLFALVLAFVFNAFFYFFFLPSFLLYSQPEWFIANTGAIIAGCIAAGIYTTNNPEACHYVSEHSEAEIVVVEGNKQLAKYAVPGLSLPHLKAIVVYDETNIDKALAAKCGVPVYGWDDFMNLGVTVKNSEVDQRGALIRPGNCATLIYTSGILYSLTYCTISNCFRSHRMTRIFIVLFVFF